MSSKDAESTKPQGEAPIAMLPFSEAEIDSFLEEVHKYLEKLEEVGMENLHRADQDAPEAVNASHRLAWAATLGIIKRFDKRTATIPKDKEAELNHRLVLAISFLQGISLCYDAIRHGLYVQAGALLRQEMETIAAIVEVRRKGEVKRLKSGGHPIGNVDWNMNRYYGGLSDAVHMGNPDLLDALYRSQAKPEEGLTGRPIRTMPLYSKIDAVNLLAFQAGLILQLFNEIQLVLMECFGEGASAIETQAWHRAVASFQKAGFLIQKDQTVQRGDGEVEH